MDFELMLKYVHNVLKENNAIKPKKPTQFFRSRITHTYRVYEWAKRIAPDRPNCNKDILFTAAIFHDSGYAIGKENHAAYSAKIFKSYAEKNNFDKEFTDEVVRIIALHSDKSLLKKEDTSDELVLLLEADLLDEEGAMGIVWDLLSQGYQGCDNYEAALDALWIHSSHILNQDYMVTPIAKKYWEEKKELVRNFIKNLESDLFLGRKLYED
ncbi:MAG: HD domain-containing protein [Acholeplasmatales bacterium]|nr:HD domain-containing protein [Acholeplasmatales bacterium]